MNSRVSIVAATSEHANSVLALARELATTFELSEQDFLANYPRLLDNPDALLLLAQDEEEMVVGYLLGFVHDTFYANGPVAWIEEVVVDPQLRRTGVGTALNEEFETRVRDRGAKVVALATRRAFAFYQAAGYEESATYFRKLL